MTTPETPSETPGTAPRNDRRRWRRAYLLGAGSVLAVELVVAAFVLHPPVSVAGTAVPAQPAPATPSRTEPATDGQDEQDDEDENADERDDAGGDSEPTRVTEPPATAPSGQRPGTVRLPNGGTATLVRQELGPDAVLPVPDDLGEATWWGAGLDAPSGASVFAGHVNWQGRVGPFAELWDIRVGQQVIVVDEDGSEFTYSVTQIVTLGKDELPARATELFGQSGPHRLVLVTCGGRWLGGTTGYAENRVVIAEPEG